MKQVRRARAARHGSRAATQARALRRARLGVKLRRAQLEQAFDAAERRLQALERRALRQARAAVASARSPRVSWT